MTRTQYLEQFRQLRSQGYNKQSALNRIVYQVANLDYDNDEDEICDLMAFLSLNDQVRDF